MLINHSRLSDGNSFADRRHLLFFLFFTLYSILSIFPDISSLIVSWPWVIVLWFACTISGLWLLQYFFVGNQVFNLGFGVGQGIILLVIGLLGSALMSQFLPQVLWYSSLGFFLIVTLYVLGVWCVPPANRQRILLFQATLILVFIGLSLFLWTAQTLLPELQRLVDLKRMGLDLAFDFSVLELRNWAPLGHQNYVAGYLVLAVPLLVGFTITSTGWFYKSVYCVGVVLGLVALYTTSSRGGVLGVCLEGLLVIIAVMTNSQIALKIRLGALSLCVAGFGSILATNNRLRALITPSGVNLAAGEIAFRWITNATGWSIGRDRPFFGAGPGSVPLSYQKYRPAWAGQEAEWVYQLHSTPAQIWAEFGAWGIALSLVLVGWLIYWGVKLWRSPRLTPFNRVFTWSILSSLAGYGVVAFTDYQLDVVAISGTLVVYLVSFLSLLRETFPSTEPSSSPTGWRRFGGIFSVEKLWNQPILDQPQAVTFVHARKCQKTLAWGILGFLIAIWIWLTPILRAWQLSSVGFAALQAKDLVGFERALTQAHKLAPWEPYYLYQLGWNFGNAGLQVEEPSVRQQFIRKGQEALEQSLKVSPYQEFGYSNLGWLQLLTGQSQATQSFTTAARLVPGKKLVFHALGLSLLQEGKTDLAIQSFALELARNPLWLTSPVWRSPQLQAIAGQVQASTIRIHQKLLAEADQPQLETYLHQCLGGLYWWGGDLSAAKPEWQQSGSELGLGLLAIAQNQPLATKVPIFKAWLEPSNRTRWVEQALLYATKAPPQPTQVQTIISGMASAQSFDQWIKQLAPISQYRRERAGFGVLSRHIDGPSPVDFAPIVDNFAVVSFFSELFPTIQFDRDLDQVLQPLREELWQAI